MVLVEEVVQEHLEVTRRDNSFSQNLIRQII